MKSLIFLFSEGGQEEIMKGNMHEVLCFHVWSFWRVFVHMKGSFYGRVLGYMNQNLIKREKNHLLKSKASWDNTGDLTQPQSPLIYFINIVTMELGTMENTQWIIPTSSQEGTHRDKTYLQHQNQRRDCNEPRGIYKWGARGVRSQEAIFSVCEYVCVWMCAYMRVWVESFCSLALGFLLIHTAGFDVYYIGNVAAMISCPLHHSGAYY